ncbi:hypothetical protein CJU73_19315 [Pseudomonas fragi]|uniref:DUF2946 domain-containing protein n=1 Tax=Pseudomonas fragi TaxID=296 RepID=UPI000BA283B0|nr:DUF2946 domain-containing protein [Pseudomonas fragi]PAA24865.1 hypothetical protein CJU73_19315 [Pseudomonas fragi]
MTRQRFAFAWIACFAVLFNMLAMSMAGATQSADQGATEQFMWSSFCSSTGTKMVAVSLGKFEPADGQQDDHSNMQHCWCCSGAAPVVALPAHIPKLYFAAIERGHSLLPDHLKRPTPRQQWPSLNPRASPLV